MKTKLPLLLTILLPLALHAATDLSTALQKGLFEEEANQNLPAAIQAYQSLLAASDDQRKLAATALFRLGECYRKLGQTNDAIAQYQRLIRDFTDQTTLATLSRQNLVGLGSVPATTTARSPEGSRPGSSIAAELARTEGILAQLKGWDLSQLRRLIPRLIPDAEFEQLDKELAGYEEPYRRAVVAGQGRPSLGTEHDAELDLRRKRLIQRSDELLRILESRVENLRAQVSEQMTEARKAQRVIGNELPALTPAQVEAQRLLVERLELEIKTAEAEIARYNELIEQGVGPRNSADKAKANLLDLKRQLVLARDAQTAVPQVQSEALQSAAFLKQLQDLSRTELVRVLPTVAPDELLNSLLEKRAQAERNLATLNVSFASSHPDVKAAEATLTNPNMQITERVDGIMQGLAINAAALKAQSRTEP